MVVLSWMIVNLSKNSFNNKKENNRRETNLTLPTGKRRIKGNLGYSPFQKWENRNFRLENQIARAIPSGKVQKNTDSDLTRCKFSLFILFSKLGYTCSDSHSHHVNFYKFICFMFMHRIFTRMVCVNSKHPPVSRVLPLKNGPIHFLRERLGTSLDLGKGRKGPGSPPSGQMPLQNCQKCLADMYFDFFALISFSDPSDIWCFIRVSSPWVWSLSWNIPSHHARQACQHHPTVTMVTLSQRERQKSVWVVAGSLKSNFWDHCVRVKLLYRDFKANKNERNRTLAMSYVKCLTFLLQRKTCIFAGSLLRHLLNEHDFFPHDVW